MAEEEGFRFHPTDSELLTFLLRFLAEQPLCDDGFITVRDVYEHEPWVTYGCGRSCGEEDGDTSTFRYFITPRKKKGNDRFSRGVAGDVGTWKGLDKGKQVTTMTKKKRAVIIGLKKSLSYEINRKKKVNYSSQHGKWLMKEYEFCPTLLAKFAKSGLKDYVICAIKSKPNKNSNQNIVVEPTVQIADLTTCTSQINNEMITHPNDGAFGFNNVPVLEPQIQDHTAYWLNRANEYYATFHEALYGEKNDDVLGLATSQIQDQSNTFVSVVSLT